MAHSRKEEGEDSRMEDKNLGPAMVMASSSILNVLPHVIIKLCSQYWPEPQHITHVLPALLQKNMGSVRVHFSDVRQQLLGHRGGRHSL